MAEWKSLPPMHLPTATTRVGGDQGRLGDALKRARKTLDAADRVADR